MNCYEVMEHKRGERYADDKCISMHTCLTKEQAESICKDLNNSKLRGHDYKYYWRIRT